MILKTKTAESIIEKQFQMAVFLALFSFPYVN
jgi:hypothetical protein